MVPVDSEIRLATALVIDGNDASRSALVNMLREFGLAEVTQARRAQDARRLLEQQRFDIVVCEYEFEGEPLDARIALALYRLTGDVACRDDALAFAYSLAWRLAGTRVVRLPSLAP